MHSWCKHRPHRAEREKMGLHSVHLLSCDLNSLYGVHNIILLGCLKFLIYVSGNLVFLNDMQRESSTVGIKPRPRVRNQAQKEAFTPTLLELVRAAWKGVPFPNLTSFRDLSPNPPLSEADR